MKREVDSSDVQRIVRAELGYDRVKAERFGSASDVVDERFNRGLPAPARPCLCGAPLVADLRGKLVHAYTSTVCHRPQDAE